MNILVLGKGISNTSLHEFMNKYGITHDFLELNEVTNFDYQTVIKGPGIYYNEKVIQEFLRNNATVITDIEFISWFLNRDYIAVTGTNGKTTTTMLIEAILNQNASAIACGNIGYPFAKAALEYKKYHYFVLELSSFELKGIQKFAPKIAVVTNIKQAHLDYHGSIEDYYKAKYNITKNQVKSDLLIYNLDDEISNILFKNSEAKKLTYSLNNPNSDCYIKRGFFFYKGKRVCKTCHLKNQNKSVLLDALAAIIVAKENFISNYKIIKAFKKFKFAQYRFAEICKGVYNDAKSTNIYSTMSALESIKEELFLICGGYDRKEDLNNLYLKSVKRVYAYGMVKEKIATFCKKRKISVLIFDNLKDATLKALNDRIDEAILYSPMFASYDQYNSFNERGKEFNEIVLNYYKKRK